MIAQQAAHKRHSSRVARAPRRRAPSLGELFQALPKLHGYLARFGWRPATVSRVLILPNDRTLRRVVERHAQTMAAIYPQLSRELRAWRWRPSGAISAIWFVSEGANSGRLAF